MLRGLSQLRFKLEVLIFMVAIVLGSVLWVGSFFFRNVDLVMRGEKAACRSGAVAACVKVGRRYQEKDSIFGGLSTARDYFQRGCELHSAESCWQVARISSGSDAVWNEVDQFRYSGLACDGGIAAACTALGKIYEVGVPSPVKYRYEEPKRAPSDYARAASLFETACAGQDTEACDELASLHHRGLP
jgi:TPR repeat protein